MENKKDKKKVKNEKAKNIIWKVVHGISYVLSGCFVAVCCFACANQGKNNKPKNNDVVLKQEELELKVLPKYIQYDDNNYQIVISPDEYIDSTFDNFVAYVIDNSLTYANVHWPTNSSAVNTLYNINSSDEISLYIIDENSDVCFGFVKKYTYDSDLIFNEEHYYLRYWAYDDVASVNYYFSSGFTITCDSGNYEGLKSAIALDISSDDGNINQGIFETLTDSLVGYVDVLGNGLNDMVSIVYNTTTNQLTVIGVLMSIVVAVSLGYFLFRLISSYVRLRG